MDDSGDSRVVVIGASAGGLEALQGFLGAVAPSSPLIIVVAQHLAPTHPSLLVDLLTPVTPLQVRVAEDGDLLQQGIVYVVPPDRDVSLSRDSIAVTPVRERVTPKPSINRLFESAAESWGEAVTAVVLSGTGSDGAEGLRAVQSAGGVTMAQTPDSTPFSGMPMAAMAGNVVDLVGTPSELGARVGSLSLARGDLDWDLDEAGAPDMVRAVFAQLRRMLDLDFSGYKTSTVRRQIQRRMALNQIASIDDYFALLAADPDEARHLADNLLVTVTEFFRDKEAFEALRVALARLVAQSDDGTPIRIWVPGCATGEEVYSLAMIVADLLGTTDDLDKRLRVFGTDLDEPSLVVARQGHYPDSARIGIPTRYQEMFLTEDADGFLVSDELRRCTVFARHDVGEDPPFPNMDLVSCRNTLIYFKDDLQRRVLALLAYSVHPGGLLFLGRTESLDPEVVPFTSVDAQWRIFERTDQPTVRPDYPFTRSPSRFTRQVGAAGQVPLSTSVVGQDHSELLEALLRSSGRRFMVIDDSQELIEVVGDVSPFCRVPEGRATTSALALLLPEVRDETRSLILLSQSEGTEVTGGIQHLENDIAPFRISVRPVPLGDRDLHVVEFLAASPMDQNDLVRIERDVTSDEIIHHLEDQLRTNQRTLRRSLLELQTANEELEASSEELQAASEELQAANEELASSNEELQATNEELGTLNQALVTRSSQLEQLNGVLERIQDAQNQGMVIVDHAGLVVKFTPTAVRVFALMDEDVGKSLLDIPTTVPVDGLEGSLALVLSGGARESLEILGQSSSYLVQVLPFRSQADAPPGAILTLTDISEMVELRSAMETSLAQLRESQTELQQQATYDSVTGLLNRGAFSAALTREVARAVRTGVPLSLVWVDVDHFKEINDAHGHETGDLALRLCGERIQLAVREADFVGRLGGDEFGVLLTDYRSTAEVDSVLDRMVSVLNEPLQTAGTAVPMSASLGIAQFPTDAENGEALLRAADAAMYEAKRQGGNTHAYFAPSMNQAADELRRFRADMQVAIEQRQFALHYQPIVSLSDGRPVAAEALLRWRRDEAWLLAGEFVSRAEETGQIRELGLESLSLLREDVVALRTARVEGLDLSLNLSVQQLEDPLFRDLIRHWPSPGGLEGITIEILESAFLPERSTALEMVHRLADLGARVAVDDYGSGYSNLKLLQSLSPDFLKLDSSFLTTEPVPTARSALIESVVVLARVIGARVIAEGVESEEQMAFLRSVGVDMAQGFYIAPAMPMEALLEWLNRD